MSEHLSPGLQLPRRLLPRCEHSCQGLCPPAAPGRARATAFCSILPAGALAPASRCDKPRHWTCHHESYAATISEPSRLTPGHLQTHFFHRKTKTPERCSAHWRHQGLPSQPPAQPHLTGHWVDVTATTCTVDTGSCIVVVLKESFLSIKRKRMSYVNLVELYSDPTERTTSNISSMIAFSLTKPQKSCCC